MFFLAMPKESEALDALQTEAARYRDMEVEPHTREAYFNVTHQTLDIFRAAIVDKAVTHILKVHTPLRSVGLCQLFSRHFQDRTFCRQRMCILQCTWFLRSHCCF